MAELCRCCAGSRCEETTEVNTCVELGAECRPYEGGCLVRSGLELYVDRSDDPVNPLLAADTIVGLATLRDSFLAETALGTELLAYNRAFAREGLALAQGHPELFSEALRVLLAGATFGRVLLGELDKPDSAGEWTWGPAIAERADRVLASALELIDDKEMRNAVQHVRNVNRRFAGQGPRAIVELVRSGETFSG